MADAVEKAKEVVEAAAHPVETAKKLEHEAERGRSPRTPIIALTGVTLLVGVVVAIVLAAALVVYFVYGGR
jgi:hypothetical protein